MNLHRGFVGLFCQFLNLACHYRKTTSLLAGTRCLNRSIERKKIRLFCNRCDQCNRIFNLLRRLIRCIGLIINLSDRLFCLFVDLFQFFQCLLRFFSGSLHHFNVFSKFCHLIVCLIHHVTDDNNTFCRSLCIIGLRRRSFCHIMHSTVNLSDRLCRRGCISTQLVRRSKQVLALVFKLHNNFCQFRLHLPYRPRHHSYFSADLNQFI